MLRTTTSLRYCLLVLFACVTGAQAATREVTLDPTKTGEPISPYVYGQFIEHLGRCIYGGIWAEMLEDRKFYFPVTGDYAPYKELTDTAYPVVGASPWQIIGAANGVTMVTDHVFVGDHTPRLEPGTAIQQHDLGVLANKDYTGYIWVDPLEKSADVDVSLVWGTGPTERATSHLHFSGHDYAKQNFSFHAGANTDHATLEIKVLQKAVLIGTVSLMPADNIHGMRADTIALLKRLGGTIYRWPGGNFTSGYDWRDGIGDRDRRPPRKNPAWTGVEHNDFGTDEFIDFCHLIGTEPLIAANTGFGDAHSAAEWVEYCNSNASTYNGGKRAQLGHPEPYHVTHWCVGNEMFGPWQLGFMQLAQYTEKHNRVATAMRKVDPNLVLIGVGDLEQINTAYDPDQAKRHVGWSQAMLESSADYMTFISEHFYRGRLPWEKNERNDLLEHAVELKESIRHKAEGHLKLQPTLPQLHGRIVKVSMDEWNYWHREYIYGELGCRYDLADGLGVAEGLNEFYRQTKIIEMAFYAQTVNVIGAIKTSRTAAQMETTGLTLEMYRHHYGTIPLVLADDGGPIDVAAALTTDRRHLTVSVVNPTKETALVHLALAGHPKLANGTRWSISGADEHLYNAPGEPQRVSIEQADRVDGNTLEVPALGCAVFDIPTY
ncbi:MAG TPA: alpha-L-arabinofuranosidase C-terminal domain-containing protein [Opitutaceae bacterium]